MKRALLLAAAAILLAAPSIYWLRQQRAAAARLADWEAGRAREAPPPVLAKIFDWERADLTLGEFCKLVAAKSGLAVEIDTNGIASDAARLRWTPQRRKT
jgi:hypothetical protein